MYIYNVYVTLKLPPKYRVMSIIIIFITIDIIIIYIKSNYVKKNSNIFSRLYIYLVY